MTIQSCVTCKYWDKGHRNQVAGNCRIELPPWVYEGLNNFRRATEYSDSCSLWVEKKETDANIL